MPLTRDLADDPFRDKGVGVIEDGPQIGRGQFQVSDGDNDCHLSVYLRISCGSLSSTHKIRGVGKREVNPGRKLEDYFGIN